MTDSLMGGASDGGQGNQDGGTGGAPDNSGASNAPEWLAGIEGIDTEIIGDPSLKTINDIPNLVKSFVNAQKMVGADRVLIPKPDADKTEWDNFYSKIGKPTDLEEFKLGEIEDSTFDDSFMAKFKEVAFEANLLPGQADKLLQAMNAHEMEANKTFQETAKANHAKAVEDLKGEWGEAFDQNIALSQSAAKEFGGQEFIDYLNTTGLGNDPQLVRIFSKIGKGLGSEDNAGSGTSAGRATGGFLTPDEAKAKYLAIMGDKTDVYHDASKPGHKMRIDEVQKLFVAMEGARG